MPTKTDNFSLPLRPSWQACSHIQVWPHQTPGLKVASEWFNLQNLQNISNLNLYLCLLFIVAVSNVKLLFQQDPFFLNFPNCLLCSNASRQGKKQYMDIKGSFVVHVKLFWISFGPTCHALIQGECWALPISRPFLDRRGGIPQPPKLSIFTLALLPPLVFLFESVFIAHSSLAIGAMDEVLLVLKFSAAAVLSARFLQSLFCVFRFVCFVFCCFCFLLYYRFCIDSLWGLSF